MLMLLPFQYCTVLHLGLHILLSQLPKIGWTARSEYAAVCCMYKNVTTLTILSLFSGIPLRIPLVARSQLCSLPIKFQFITRER